MTSLARVAENAYRSKTIVVQCSIPRHQKFRAMNGAHLASPIRGELGYARNRNRKLQTSKAPLKSQAQGTSLFTSAASKQRGFPIVRGRLRSGCQRVRECVKSEGFSKE